MSNVDYDLGTRQIHIGAVDAMIRSEFPDETTGISVDYPILHVQFVADPPADAKDRIVAIIDAHAPLFVRFANVDVDGVMRDVLGIQGDLAVTKEDAFIVLAAGVEINCMLDNGFAVLQIFQIDEAMIKLTFADPTRNPQEFMIGSPNLKEITADAVVTYDNSDPSLVQVMIETERGIKTRANDNAAKDIPLATTLDAMDSAALDSYFASISSDDIKTVLKIVYLRSRR